MLQYDVVFTYRPPAMPAMPMANPPRRRLKWWAMDIYHSQPDNEYAAEGAFYRESGEFVSALTSQVLLNSLHEAMIDITNLMLLTVTYCFSTEEALRGRRPTILMLAVGATGKRQCIARC